MVSDVWVQEIVTLYRWLEKGALHVRCREPSAKTLEALDYLDNAISTQVNLKPDPDGGRVDG